MWQAEREAAEHEKAIAALSESAQAQQAEAEAQHQAVLDALRETGLQKVMLRMQRRHIAGAFAAWTTRSHKAKQMKAAAARVVGRLQNACIVSAYGRWVEYSAQLARYRRVGARLQDLVVSRCLSTCCLLYTSPSPRDS